MDIHKPKPVHSFREFLNEIAVIITGVLIALALEQAVEQWHWHNQVIEARETLREEVADSLSSMQHSVANSACALGNIAHFKQLVQERNIAAVKAAVAGNPFTTLGLWQLGTSNMAWQSVNAAGLMAHVGSKERLSFANTYYDIDSEHDFRIANWAKINDLVVKAVNYDGSPEATRVLLDDASSIELFYRTRVVQYPHIFEVAYAQIGVRPKKPTSEEHARFDCHSLKLNGQPS